MLTRRPQVRKILQVKTYKYDYRITTTVNGVRRLTRQTLLSTVGLMDGRLCMGCSLYNRLISCR